MIAVKLENITGVVLCGGQSRRFGSDKSVAIIEGVSMMERSMSVLEPMVSETLIACGPSHRQYPYDLRHVEDSFLDAGPLAGILAALDVSSSAYLLVLAVDLPFVSTSSLQKLVSQCGEVPDAIVVAGSSAKNQSQPLCGIWPRTVRNALNAYLESGKRSVFGFLEEQRVSVVEFPEEELRNVNSRRDLDENI